jgi:hypothetical protein
MDPKAVFTQFIDEMNAATKSREYVPFAGKWFAPDGTLSLYYKTQGLEKAKIIFTHIVPTGDDPTRQVVQFIHAVDGNMIHSFRRIESSQLPQPVYGLQDSGFDARTFINYLRINAVPEEVITERGIKEDEAASKTRIGRIFHAFEEAFNEYFLGGPSEMVSEWFADDITVIVEHEYTGMNTLQHWFRVVPSAEFVLQGFEDMNGNDGVALMEFKNWGGLNGDSRVEFGVKDETSLTHFDIRPQF